MNKTGKYFKIYKNGWHLLGAFCIIIVPFLAIIILGKINKIDIEAIFYNLSISFYRLSFAYLISLALSIILAISLWRSKFSNFFTSLFDIMQNIPSFALIPFFVIWFGYTNEMVIVFATTAMLWPILFSILAQLKELKTDLSEAAEIFGAKGLKKIVYYILPCIFPAVISGSIIGIAMGWETIIGVEMIGMSTGIGSFLNIADKTNQEQTILFAVLAL
ncbi:ABC transporter permease subunit, partial [bacterium]|nr:ABC transporter permease subunit [bacterium]